MRPRLVTPRNIALLLVAFVIAGALFRWLSLGAPLPGRSIASTAGKIVFVSDRSGQKDLWMMDGATGANAVALTSDDPEDRQPSFSNDGKTVVFTSANRNGVSPQVYTIDAAPNSRPFRLTSTSSAKFNPVFAPENNHVSFLDTGKLLEVNVEGQDSHTVFPEADLKRLMTKVLATGGVETYAQSRTSERFALVLNTEAGQSLLIYEFNEDKPESLFLAQIGQGRKISIHSVDDGSFVATFVDGGPLQEPMLLLNPQILAAMDLPVEQRPPLPLDQPLAVQLQEGVNVLARFDATGAVQGAAPLPFAPADLAAARDGSRIALTVEEGKTPGVFSLAFSEEGAITRLYDKPSREAAFAPDNKGLVFVSDKDIYYVAADGNGGAPKRLTEGGKGQNFAPQWSPTKPEVTTK